MLGEPLVQISSTVDPRRQLSGSVLMSPYSYHEGPPGQSSVLVSSEAIRRFEQQFELLRPVLDLCREPLQEVPEDFRLDPLARRNVSVSVSKREQGPFQFDDSDV